ARRTLPFVRRSRGGAAGAGRAWQAARNARGGGNQCARLLRGDRAHGRFDLLGAGSLGPPPGGTPQEGSRTPDDKRDTDLLPGGREAYWAGARGRRSRSRGRDDSRGVLPAGVLPKLPRGGRARGGRSGLCRGCRANADAKPIANRKVRGLLRDPLSIGTLALLRRIPRGRGGVSGVKAPVDHEGSGRPDPGVRTSRFKPLS